MAPPAPAPAVVETAEPAPAAPPASVEAPAPEPPAAAPEPAAATPPAPDAEAAAEVPAWTDVQDALLLGLKALNKTWKEIGAMVEGKDTEDLRDRYAELTAVKTKGKKAEAAGEEANTPETTEEEGEGKKGGDKKNNKKDKKQNKKKGDKGEASNQENNDEEATKKDKQGRKLRGILKLDEATDEGAAAGQPDSDDEPQFYRGHPVIYVDDEDGLSAREVRASLPPPPFIPTHTNPLGSHSSITSTNTTSAWNRTNGCSCRRSCWTRRGNAFPPRF